MDWLFLSQHLTVPAPAELNVEQGRCGEKKKEGRLKLFDVPYF